MKNRLRFLVIAMLFPISLCAQKENSLRHAWDKPFSSLEEIVNHYKRDQQKLNSDASIRNTCYVILKSGEYIMHQKGNVDKMCLLLQQIPLPQLDHPVVLEFMEENTISFVDYYFMIKELKHGIPFDKARDGLALTTEFQGRSLNHSDYNKLKAIFKGSNEKLKSIYLEKFKTLFRNYGCTDNMYNLKSVIQNHISDSLQKNEVLSLYDRYEKIRTGQPAPTPMLKDAMGEEYDFKDFLGKVIVVDVWATWCCVCIEKMPAFMRLQDKFKNNGNVVFLTISIDRKSSHVKWLKAIKENNMGGMLNLISDQNSEFSFEAVYCIPSVPRYLVIDRNGNIVDAYAPSPDSGLEEVIIKTLSRSQPEI